MKNEKKIWQRPSAKSQRALKWIWRQCFSASLKNSKIKWNQVRARNQTFIFTLVYTPQFMNFWSPIYFDVLLLLPTSSLKSNKDALRSLNLQSIYLESSIFWSSPKISNLCFPRFMFMVNKSLGSVGKVGEHKTF